MKITIAETAGFCMGVKRAVDTAFEHARKTRGPVYTFGPLIHNPQVMTLLADRGVGLLEEIPVKGEGSVIIRAHGIPPQQHQDLQEAGFEIIDATCPKVIKIQRIIQKHHREGCAIIIIGENDHPEIIGLNGYADNQAQIVHSLNELQALPVFKKAVIVAQTTLNLGLFAEVRRWAESERPHYKTINTICDSTEKRQKELRQLSNAVDGFIIVGGFESGNTRRLAEVAAETGRPALHVESFRDLASQNLAPFAHAEEIVISAGASTPNWTIQAVCHTLEITRLKRRSPRYFYAKLLPFLYLVHVPLALAALTVICQHFYAAGSGLLFPVLAFCYGWSMHVTSKISGTKAAGFHAPLLAGFYDNCKQLIAASCLISGMITLLLAFYAGTAVGIIIVVMFLLRLLYDFLPLARRVSGNYTYFIDMPYSKAVCVAIAWGLVTAILPGWNIAMPTLTFLAFGWAALAALARVMCQDLFAMQTDRICGQTTLMLLLGTRRGLYFTNILLLLLVLFPAGMYFTGWMPATGLPAMLCPALMLTVVTLHAGRRNRIPLPFKMEMLVSKAFIVTGLIMLAI